MQLFGDGMHTLSTSPSLPLISFSAVLDDQDYQMPLGKTIEAGTQSAFVWGGGGEEQKDLF